ncbi:MAG: O-antigen ligase family protein [Candidatus Aminicenantes bacterium]|nr:O-antigen ligase family protein [Candidatus Aminicenantes bacterium]
MIYLSIADIFIKIKITGGYVRLVRRFDWVQLAVLVLLSPVFLFPREQWAWVLAIVPLLMAARRIVNKKFIERTIIDIPLLVILVMVLITTVWKANPLHGLPKIAGLLLGVGLFYAVTAVLKTEKLIKIATILFLCGGVLFSLLGVVGMFTFKVKYLTLLMKLKEWLPRIHFNLPGAEEGFHPNAVGGTLVLIIPLFMVLLFAYLWKKIGEKASIAAGNRLMQLFLLAGLAITLCVLLLTQSRGAWLGLLLACVIGFFLFLLKRKVFLIVFLVGILLFAFVIAPSLLENDQVRLTTRQAEGTFFFRIQLWNVVLPMIHENPLLGIGLNEFRYHYEVKRELSHPHNKLLLLAVELGLPGLIAYLALLGCVGVAVVRIWKKPGNEWLSLAALGLGCGQLAHFIFEMTDAVPLGAKVNVFFWLSLALVMAIYNYTYQND